MTLRAARLALSALLLRAADALWDAAMAVAPGAPRVVVRPHDWPAPPPGVDPRPN